jgi:hypothetical protein
MCRIPATVETATCVCKGGSQRSPPGHDIGPRNDVRGQRAAHRAQKEPGSPTSGHSNRPLLGLAAGNVRVRPAGECCTTNRYGTREIHWQAAWLDICSAIFPSSMPPTESKGERANHKLGHLPTPARLVANRAGQKEQCRRGLRSASGQSSLCWSSHWVVDGKAL